MKQIKIKGEDFTLEDRDYCFAALLEDILTELKRGTYGNNSR